MKLRRNLIAMLTASVMAVSLLAGCGGGQESPSGGANSSDSEHNSGAENTQGENDTQGNEEDASAGGAELSGEIFELEMVIATFGSTPADLDAVVDEINRISEAEVGVRIHMTPISLGDYDTQVNLMLSSNEKLDLLPVLSNNFSGYISKGQLLPIDEELEQYGQGITEVIENNYLEAGKSGGEQYGITTNRDLAKNFGIMMRADLAEKYGVDYDTLDNLEDFEAVLAAVAEGEEGIVPLVPPSEKTTWYDRVNNHDILGDGFGALMNGDDSLTVVNLYATDEYKEFVTLMRNWYQSGYILEDASTASEVGPSLVKAGRAFGYLTVGKPGYTTQEGQLSGHEMKFVELKSAVTTTSIVQTLQWCVPRNCENTEKTMQFLNLMYTSAEIQNLLSWGIEGQHYEVTQEGFATYPDGVDASNTGYGLSMGWQMGNQFLTYPWEGDEIDIWEQMDVFNKGAQVSAAMGFVFDSSPVNTEIAACSNVTDKYRISLECGMVDPEKVLPDFLQELEDAGLNKIMEEKQAQLDDWAAGNQ